MSYLAKAREPISSLSHCIGAVVFAAATLLLVGKTLFDDWSPKILVGVIVFGASLVALYSASAIYHFSNGSAKRILRLRKLDHSMIYVLIAGSYTPILLKYLPQHESLVFVSVIWGCAVLGVVIKLCWFSAPRWLQTVLYIAMGWVCVLAMPQLVAGLSFGAFMWLLAGGLFYTVGGVIYAMKFPVFHNRFQYFGCHELFHVFVMAGSLCHFIVMYVYLCS